MGIVKPAGIGTRHNLLSGRGENDAHPIGAVTGLQNYLNANDLNINNLQSNQQNDESKLNEITTILDNYKTPTNTWDDSLELAISDCKANKSYEVLCNNIYTFTSTHTITDGITFYSNTTDGGKFIYNKSTGVFLLIKTKYGFIDTLQYKKKAIFKNIVIEGITNLYSDTNTAIKLMADDSGNPAVGIFGASGIFNDLRIKNFNIGINAIETFNLDLNKVDIEECFIGIKSDAVTYFNSMSSLKQVHIFNGTIGIEFIGSQHWNISDCTFEGLQIVFNPHNKTGLSTLNKDIIISNCWIENLGTSGNPGKVIVNTSIDYLTLNTIPNDTIVNLDDTFKIINLKSRSESTPAWNVTDPTLRPFLSKKWSPAISVDYKNYEDCFINNLPISNLFSDSTFENGYTSTWGKSGTDVITQYNNIGSDYAWEVKGGKYVKIVSPSGSANGYLFRYAKETMPKDHVYMISFLSKSHVNKNGVVNFVDGGGAISNYPDASNYYALENLDNWEWVTVLVKTANSSTSQIRFQNAIAITQDLDKYYGSMMMIDLTFIFGKGNEPDIESAKRLLKYIKFIQSDNYNQKHKAEINTVPTTGTWNVNEWARNILPTSGNYSGWICTDSGTFGALAGCTGSTIAWTPTITVNNGLLLKIGDWISIAGVAGKFKVIDINGNTVILHDLPNTTVNNANVSYYNPTLKGFGILQ